MMLKATTNRVWKKTVSLRGLFGLKLVYDLVLTGLFYFEHSVAIFWKLTFLVFSILVFLFVNYFYTSMKKHWLLYLLVIDFLVSASYGYIYIGGRIPNHLFNGITALAIFMFIKNTRVLIASCVLLLFLYLATMCTIDWTLYRQLDPSGYYISSSFIVFACIVSFMVHSYKKSSTDTMQLYDQLKQSHEQLRGYANQAEEWAATRERVRMTREIHDTVGHKLTALLVHMQVARKLSKLDALRSEQTYLECEGLVRSALQEVRLSVRAIRDDAHTSAPLHENLARLSEEFTKFTEVHTVLEVEGMPVDIPIDLRLTAYRIAQESLTNAQKHGHATRIVIVLVYAEALFRLIIRNNGELPVELKPGFGLMNVQERVREWGGEVHFRMEQESGFAVEVQFPYVRTEVEGEH
ncbi:sensor histidine kinase [Paenibacillus sp. CF384]|uniref:sensor histidine kinase n=1 Tax=Paenibacillus sp. CF384 TaxID=1884382 RepID=UPI00210A9FE0|nr:sensor histidine kinase [Paenibacillus sp. CF384]